MALGVPVVACENGTRPAGVITYKADDAVEMADRLAYVIANRQQVVQTMDSVEVPDTLADEIAVLTAQ
jgi:hypothetical protein